MIKISLIIDQIIKANLGDTKIGKDGIKRVYSKTSSGKLDWRRVKSGTGGKDEGEEKPEKKDFEIVHHAKFGEGEVIKREEGKITINFREFGEKTLLEKYANLSKEEGSEQKKDNLVENKIGNLLKKNKKETKSYNIPKLSISKETEKAYLLEKEGVNFWIQKKWINKEGDLTAKGEESFKEALRNQKEKEEVIKVPLEKIKESESGKATLFKIKINNGFKDQDIEVWFPNSTITDKGVNKKFLESKMQEIGDKYGLIEFSSFSKETEKAYGVKINVYENLSEQEVGRMIWIPKSQVKEKGEKYYMPKWLFHKQVEEVYESVKTGGWALSSNSVFELGGIEQFKSIPVSISKETEKIEKALQILDLF